MPGHKVNVFHTVGHSKKNNNWKATVRYVLGRPIQPSVEIKRFFGGSDVSASLKNE